MSNRVQPDATLQYNLQEPKIASTHISLWVCRGTDTNHVSDFTCFAWVKLMKQNASKITNSWWPFQNTAAHGPKPTTSYDLSCTSAKPRQPKPEKGFNLWRGIYNIAFCCKTSWWYLHLDYLLKLFYCVSFYGKEGVKQKLQMCSFKEYCFWAVHRNITGSQSCNRLLLTWWERRRGSIIQKKYKHNK